MFHHSSHFRFWGRQSLFDRVMLSVDDLGPSFYVCLWDRWPLFDRLMVGVDGLVPHFLGIWSLFDCPILSVNDLGL